MAERRHSPLKIETTAAHLCSTDLRLQILGQVPFLRDLAPADHAWINAFVHEKDYAADEVICFSGEAAEQLFIVADGRVRLLQHALSGREILLDLLTPGEFFGALSGLGNDVYPETAQAHTPCCLLVIGRPIFQQVLIRYPGVALKLIDIMAVRLRSANERLHQLSALGVEARIASILLMLADKFGVRQGSQVLLQVPLRRDDLAGMTGATTESASRVTSRFQKEGLISAGRGWVAVLDREGLQAVAGKAE